ncbi:MAG: hypothetical protein LM582_00305 [Desulfurococcaceae archaeon]|nr:hypothetical protein [Desulfurococcaceae archaeon]
MSEGEIQTITVELYAPQEIALDNVGAIVLYKKVGVELFYERIETIEKFKNDEDALLSWLLSIASSKDASVAKALVKSGGTIIEALVTTNKQLKYFVDFPYIAKVKKIYIVKNLEKALELTSKSSTQAQEHNVKTENAEISSGDDRSVMLIPLLDLSNREFYLFNSPITISNKDAAEALIIETDKGIVFLRFDNLSQMYTPSSRAKTFRKKRKGKKKRGRAGRKRRKSNSP